jgi:hypothetical protein
MYVSFEDEGPKQIYFGMMREIKKGKRLAIEGGLRGVA